LKLAADRVGKIARGYRTGARAVAGRFCPAYRSQAPRRSGL